ncbi:MAG: CdaR family protein [Oribacterium sp.]|nr:CdaR family protein [Oribacterium sp.]
MKFKAFRDNFSLKLLSFFLAILIWLIVVNVSRPEITRTQTVNLDIESTDTFNAENKKWSVDRNTVTISYKVRTDQAATISADDFHAYIDLKDYSITGSVPVYVNVAASKENTVDDVTVRPTVIHVTLEDIQEKKFDLKVHQSGNPADGYAVSSIILSPETVYVTGPESQIGRISSVGISVDVNGLTGNKDATAKPVLYDANGNAITLNDVTLSTESVHYSVTLHKKKSINLLPSVTGTPATGYQYESTTVSPQSEILAGAPGIIDQMTVFELPTIDISGATDSITETFRLKDYLPSGIELAEPNAEVIVTVRIEKIPETEEESTTTAESSAEIPHITEAETTLPETSVSEAPAETSEAVSGIREPGDQQTKSTGSEHSEASAAITG